MSNNKVAYIAKYVTATDQLGSVPCTARDLRFSKIIALEYLPKVQQQKLEQISERFDETILLIKIVLPLSLALKTGDLKLADLKKLNLSERIYSALAEMSYFATPLEDLKLEELIEIIHELFHEVGEAQSCVVGVPLVKQTLQEARGSVAGFRPVELTEQESRSLCAP